MKVLLIMLINIPLLVSVMTVKGQVIYQDNFVKIMGYINDCDSLLYFQIENISDSVLVLNEKNINFEKIRNNEWAADLSLLTSGASFYEFQKAITQDEIHRDCLQFSFHKKY
jgi:hypothetical protein